MKLKIVIADDHEIVRKGMQQIILEEFPFAEVKGVGDAEELLKEVMTGEYTLVISDLSMPGRSGLEALVQIKQIEPSLPVLILSMHPEEQYAVRVLKAGASGYLKKDLAPEELIKAIRAVQSGKKYITESVADKLFYVLNSESEKLPHELLSDREYDVFILLAMGVSITDISLKLHVSPSTVSTYRSRILGKMNMKNNADLTQYVIQHNLK